MVVPAIVKQKGIELHAALLGQFASKCVHGIQRISLGVWREVTKVVPRVVMKKRPVGMGALLLKVRKKVAAHLTVACHSNYRGVGDGLASAQRQSTVNPRRGAVPRHFTL